MINAINKQSMIPCVGVCTHRKFWGLNLLRPILRVYLQDDCISSIRVFWSFLQPKSKKITMVALNSYSSGLLCVCIWHWRFVLDAHGAKPCLYMWPNLTKQGFHMHPILQLWRTITHCRSITSVWNFEL